MAPKEKELNEELNESADLALGTPAQPTPWVYKWQWSYVLLCICLHGMALSGVYAAFSAKWQTLVFNFIMNAASLVSITAGAHRLFSHKAYKAKWPLRLIFVLLNTFSLQKSTITWVQVHRMHHKYTETDADPHNSTRGFLFSHFLWLLVYPHPDFERKVKDLDLSDVYADPILRFQDKFYFILAPLIGLLPSIMVPVWFWDESWFTSYTVAVLRIVISLHLTFLVNSAAHMWGNKPYDKNLRATDSIVVTPFVLGEGFHNYHHTFPWDYKAAELGNNVWNFSTLFINFFAKIGWAYDLKTASEESVRKRLATTGDGSRHLWGWGDRDQTKEDVSATIIINPKDD